MNKLAYVYMNDFFNINFDLNKGIIEKEREIFSLKTEEFCKFLLQLKQVESDDLIKVLNNVSVENYEMNNNKMRIIIKVFSDYEIEYERYDRKKIEFIKKEKGPLFYSTIELICTSCNDNVYINEVNIISISDIGFFIENNKDIKMTYINSVEKYIEINLLKFIQDKNIDKVIYKGNEIKVKLNFEIPNNNINDLVEKLLTKAFKESKVTVKLYENKNNVNFVCAIDN